MKITKTQLRKIINESMGHIMSDSLGLYVGHLRATQLWFHAAHNLTKGTGFSGDHVNLYGEIYQQLQDDFDVAVEKAIGLTQNESLGCPVGVTSSALDVLVNVPSPSDSSALDIAVTALALIESHIALLEEIFNSLEAANELPLGLNDFLAASANRYDTYVYLLKQRLKDV